MTQKVRVCVGVNGKGDWSAKGDCLYSDEQCKAVVSTLLASDPTTKISFHDIEIGSPQAIEPVAEVGKFKRGDVVTLDRKPGKKWKVWRVTNGLFIHACRLDMELPSEGTNGNDLRTVPEIDWVCSTVNKFTHVTPQAEEVKAPSSVGQVEEFEIGDLIREKGRDVIGVGDGRGADKQLPYAVVTSSRPSKCEGDNCIGYCGPEDFSEVVTPATYQELKKQGILANGWQPRYLEVVAKAGQWYLKDGQVVLGPEVKCPVTPDSSLQPVQIGAPKFKFKDLVTHTNKVTGEVTEWEVLSAEPDEDEMIYLGKRGFWRLSIPMILEYWKHQSSLEEAAKGLIRMAYEDDVVLDSPKEDCCTSACSACNKPKHQFRRGDLIEHKRTGKWAVVSSKLDQAGFLAVCKPRVLHTTTEDQDADDLQSEFGVGKGYEGIKLNCLTLVATAGSWYLKDGEPVIGKPEVKQFKVGDKVRVVKAMPEWCGWVDDMDKYVGSTHTVTEAERGIGIEYEEWVRLDVPGFCVPELAFPIKCLELDTSPQSPLSVGDMAVDQNNELWDVDEIDGWNVYITSQNLVGRKAVSADTLKRVVFGSLK